MSQQDSRILLPEWLNLQKLVKEMRSRHLRDYIGDVDRAKSLLFRSGPITLDISKQQIDQRVLSALIDLAKTTDVPKAIKSLMTGNTVNNTEKRAALHTALRLPSQAILRLDNTNIVSDVHQSLLKMRGIVEKIHAQQWFGFSGKVITDIVNIGVGGSDLGPLMACHALNEFTLADAVRVNIHFVSCLDEVFLRGLLNRLNPETTLFIISSKSFTTLDTLSNANAAMQWMLEAVDNQKLVLLHHFIGISAQVQCMTSWGIYPSNQLLFWEWVGGRFSLWSVIGLPLALKIGMKNFESMLAGAYFMDEEFSQKPLDQNLPVILGLIGVWNATFLDIRSHVVLPYNGSLKYLPAYLSQLEMESNGKSVDKQGYPISYSTSPILWGEVGLKAQHAFYQLLHQGTQLVSCDFIMTVKRHIKTVDTSNLQNILNTQHQLALANCLAQSQVLMLGEVNSELGFKQYHGNKPSTTILLNELTPYTLGALIALYEHKVFVMSVLWNINPFDQWGIELGKKVSDKMYSVLSDTDTQLAVDPSTQQLLNIIRECH